MTNSINTDGINTHTAGSDAAGNLIAWATIDCVGITIQLTLGNTPTSVRWFTDDDSEECTLESMGSHLRDAMHILPLYAAALDAYRAAVRCEKEHGQLSLVSVR